MADCPRLETEEALSAFWVTLGQEHCFCISISHSHFTCVCTHHVFVSNKCLP